MSKFKIRMKEKMEIIDDISESIGDFFFITFAFFTLPIWIAPYLIYKAMKK